VREELVLVDLRGQHAVLWRRVLLLVVLVSQGGGQRVDLGACDLRHILHVDSYIVFDVYDIFYRVLALLTLDNELLNLHFLNFRHTDHKISE
jgi:hypothetical protein